MKQAVIITILFLAVGLTASCSKKPEPNAEATNTNSAVESPFANITDANEALAEGNRLLDENQTEMAIEAFRHAIKLNAELPEPYFKLGIAYSLYERQIELSGVAVAPPEKDKNGNAKPNSEKAFEKAVEAYKKWLAANPKDDVGHFNLGRTYVKLLKDEDAEESFKQAVKLKPDDTEYQTELGAILIRLALYREAIEPLKKAIELDPSNVRAQDLLEDAQAGRQRIDFVGPKNTNQATGNSNANSNSNSAASSNSNSNSAPKPPANTAPKKEDPKEKPIANK